MKHTVKELKDITYKTRRRFLELFTTLGYGHVTSAFSWAEIAVVLYYEIMKLPLDSFDYKNSDRMVVSKGHGCGILFPIFEDMNLINRSEMEEILKIGGRNNTKLKKLFYPGFDFYGGSLGIGIGMAVGLSMGDKLSKSPNLTYCILGDAECYEGSVWEAVHFAGHNKLNSLIAIVDRNGLGCSDFTENMLRLEPFKEKWNYSGWDVLEVYGHDIEMIYKALTSASFEEHEKPQCIIAHTKKGQGLSYTIDKPLMHGFMPKSESEIKRAFEELR